MGFPVGSITVRSCPSSTVWFVPERFRRSRFLGSAGGALIAIAVAPRAALASGRRSTVALALKAKNIGRRYAGDRALFATVSPGVAGTRHGRRQLRAQPRGDREARGSPHGPARDERRLDDRRRAFPPGQHSLTWTPDLATAGGLLRDAADDRPQGIRHDGPRRQAATLDREAAGTCRPRPRRRGRVPAALVRPGGADGAADPRRRRCADPAVPPLRRGVRQQRAERRDGGRPEGRPRADRLDREAVGAGHDHGSDRRLADRPLHGSDHDRRRTRGLRAVRPARRPPPASSASSSSCRPTPGRPTTCTTATATAGETRGTPAATHPSSSTAPTATAACHPASRRTTARCSAGCCARERRPTWSPTTISRPSARATSCARSTTSSSSRGTAST